MYTHSDQELHCYLHTSTHLQGDFISVFFVTTKENSNKYPSVGEWLNKYITNSIQYEKGVRPRRQSWVFQTIVNNPYDMMPFVFKCGKQHLVFYSFLKNRETTKMTLISARQNNSGQRDLGGRVGNRECSFLSIPVEMFTRTQESCITFVIKNNFNKLSNKK